MRTVDQDEYALIGIALIAAQRVEFLLYGLAAHAPASNLKAKDKRFHGLSPEDFLRGDPKKLKATLGQLVQTFGDDFLILTSDIDQFCNDRNKIAHNYFRTYLWENAQKPLPADATDFLRDFFTEAIRIEAVLKGFLRLWMRSAAEREGRTNELAFTDQDNKNIEAYNEHAIKYLKEKP